jgi:hypothetical protein
MQNEIAVCYLLHSSRHTLWLNTRNRSVLPQNWIGFQISSNTGAPIIGPFVLSHRLAFKRQIFIYPG